MDVLRGSQFGTLEPDIRARSFEPGKRYRPSGKCVSGHMHRPVRGRGLARASYCGRKLTFAVDAPLNSNKHTNKSTRRSILNPQQRCVLGFYGY